MRYNFDQLDGADDRRAAHGPLAAVPVAGVGHGDRAAGAGRQRHCAATSRLPQRAVEWLLDKEVRAAAIGPTYVTAPPGGWCFEHHNEFYPDVDDTAMVMIALQRAGGDRQRRSPAPECSGHRAGTAEREARAARHRRIAAPWSPPCERAPQLDARDAEPRRRLGGVRPRQRRRVPLPRAVRRSQCDDRSQHARPDRPGARSAGACGARRRTIRRSTAAVEFLRRTQERDGSWFGRWGVNYIYGTWQALVGLAAVGVPTDDPAIEARRELAAQRISKPAAAGANRPTATTSPNCAAKGPSPPRKPPGRCSGLMAAGLRNHKAVERGVHYLLDTQRPDGGWDEPEFTGTGFPRVFYLRYHYYPIYFPLLALAEYQRQTGSGFGVQSSGS